MNQQTSIGWKKATAVAVASAFIAGATILGTASAASAHGYVGASGSQLIARQSMSANAGIVGAARYDRQSFEAPRGFPSSGPADGHLPSAGIPSFSALDQQTSTLWAKNKIKAGPVLASWHLTAPHRTADWRYYITKPGWNQNAPITRSDLELIASIPHDGSPATTNSAHYIQIPPDHQGYNVIYAVWDVSDTSNAFYNAIDVDIEGTTPADTQRPKAPTKLRAHSTTSDTVTLRWHRPSDNVGVVEYRVFRNGNDVATVSKTTFADSGLKPSTSYTYQVEALDAAGNVSSKSQVLTVKTDAAPTAKTTPSTPKITDQDVYTDLVSLKWTASKSKNGIDHYRITRTSGSTTKTFTSVRTAYDDSSVAAGTKYGYVVQAIDAAGNKSKKSNVVSVTTPAKGVVEPDQVGVPAWDPNAAYTQGTTVSHGGHLYEAVQSYQGHGDPNWIQAGSLWRRV